MSENSHDHKCTSEAHGNYLANHSSDTLNRGDVDGVRREDLVWCFSVVAVAFLMGFVVCSVARAENLIKNGDFEDGMKGWKVGTFYMDKNCCACYENQTLMATASQECIDKGFKEGDRCETSYEESHRSLSECARGK